MNIVLYNIYKNYIKNMNVNEKVDIKSIKENPNNPRIIRNEKFHKLVKSLKEFPQMLDIRPIVVDENDIILGGNMRFKAAKEVGLQEVTITRVSGLTEEQKKEFIVKDNANFGDWDWNLLQSEWELDKIEDWGIEIEDWGNIESLESVNKGDENDEWVGMPTFDEKVKGISLIVGFKDEKDREEFVKLSKLNPRRTKSNNWSVRWPESENEMMDTSSLKIK